ncbi:insulin gene enhancer protein isl-1 isoform X2 [Eurytemora carolleeae]|uniref:insulin gene enhancer protein isl-1 isoform X2 n=1 Tax=Eurytemora carolleeae TaxID=1294199 RepID=UPI000C782F8D|nr:insulin gene enhancer protein isl-1 isoform X2 [Eurytemora carolleeae]|eukprot:XP_023339750.1 insulin gene enhancer protein isl-1-like isoform X2 [Eurytemora affinis]
MRAKTKMFHLECFRCSVCSRHLVPGDEFALHGTGLLCREDHEMVDREDNNNLTIKTEFQDNFRDNLSENGRDEDGFREDLSSLDVKSETETIRAESPDSSRGDSSRQDRIEGLEDRGATGTSDPFSPSPPSRGRGRGPGKGRSNRGRTVLTEKQRTILTACFQHNPKPDALLKLVEMTGLNARVIRVWFQNRRCKEHKRVKAEVLISRKDHQKIGYGSMNGIQMIATSPVRQDSPVDMSGVDISGFHPPWHSMQEFQLRMENPNLQNQHFNPSLGQIPGFDCPNPEMFPHNPYPDFPPRPPCFLERPPDVHSFPGDGSPINEFADRSGLTSYPQDRSEKYLSERRRPFSELHPPLERGRPFSEPQNSEEYSPYMNENEEKS